MANYINPNARDIVIEMTKLVHLTSLLQQHGKDLTPEAHDELLTEWAKGVNNIGVFLARINGGPSG